MQHEEPLDVRSLVWGALALVLFFWAPRRLMVLLGLGWLWKASSEE